MSEKLVGQLRALGLVCPDDLIKAGPAEDAYPEAPPEGEEALPARAGDPEVDAVPPDAEGVPKSKA